MKTYTVVVLDKTEREAFNRIIPSLGLVSPDTEDPRVRTIRAIGRAGADITYDILTRAREALAEFLQVCDREQHVDYWTQHLSARPEPITPDTPGDGIVANPYQACEFLAQAREAQYRDGLAAMELCQEAVNLVTPRPDFHAED